MGPATGGVFLTAAHCVEDYQDAQLWVTFESNVTYHRESFEVTAASWDPGYRLRHPPGLRATRSRDYGVVLLETTVPRDSGQLPARGSAR